MAMPKQSRDRATCCVESPSDVCVHYGSTVALAPTSFRLPRGSAVALVGSNGSGKTTLLSTIAGLVQAHRRLDHGQRHGRDGDAVAAPPPLDAAHRRRGVADGSLSGAWPDRAVCAPSDRAIIAEAADVLEVRHLRRRAVRRALRRSAAARARRPGGRRRARHPAARRAGHGSRPPEPAAHPRGDRRARRATAACVVFSTHHLAEARRVDRVHADGRLRARRRPARAGAGADAAGRGVRRTPAARRRHVDPRRRPRPRPRRAARARARARTTGCTSTTTSTRAEPEHRDGR